MGLCFKQFHGWSQAGAVIFKPCLGSGKMAWKNVHLAMVMGLAQAPFSSYRSTAG